ncbi:hypothetical protein LEP1GSC050_3819 [Leptospira broomii serovar Hurstbridge str. 5399]|uniref:Uncharacterized protein n=1 Tax=Leptospira broomii serovar Hurstbridge str. 5399 TaxID=1049789 RepID=T0GI12_9LEPT|nr:hypothetical protein LEP1GSC050_3819 [Leptospira broomii serovar Hurstbridge str. 5399]
MGKVKCLILDSYRFGKVRREKITPTDFLISAIEKNSGCPELEFKIGDLTRVHKAIEPVGSRTRSHQ